MFTRVVDIKCKTGKANEVASIAREKVLPLLKKQQDFQDEITLVSPTDPNQMRSLSFWNQREDAKRHHREQFSKIAEMLRPLCEGEPVVSTFDVNTSPIRLNNRGKAAQASVKEILEATGKPRVPPVFGSNCSIALPAHRFWCMPPSGILSVKYSS